MKRGFVHLYRKILVSEIYDDPVVLKLAVTCLLRANYRHNEVNLVSSKKELKPVKLKPGQFITSRDRLHGAFHRWAPNRDELYPSSKTLWRKVKYLETIDFLSSKSFSQYSIITITNWHNYQSNSAGVSKQCPASVHREEGIKKDKELSLCTTCQTELPPNHQYPECAKCYLLKIKREKDAAKIKETEEQRPTHVYPKCQHTGCNEQSTGVINGLCSQHTPDEDIK